VTLFLKQKKMYGVVTIAGSTTGGHKDGVGKEAKFFYPSGIAISNDKKVLYVADNGNKCIRKISLVDGTTSTIAGMPGRVNGRYSPFYSSKITFFL
jgi:sugar lactone lactonase YvrE